MPEKLFLKPVPGGLVRDPYTHARLKDDGEWKPRDTYWLRRVMFGDVMDCTAAKTAEMKLAETKIAEEPTEAPARNRAKKSEQAAGHEENR